MEATLEHINITVQEPLVTAGLLVDLFDWRIRWQGEAINGGFTVHVGGDNSYVALYAPVTKIGQAGDTHNHMLGMNHLGILVDDLKDAESKVIAAGFTTHSHGDYEPGRRFYFGAIDGLEIEVISYQAESD